MSVHEENDGVRTTPRLILRPITTADVDELVALHQDPGISTWYAGSWTTSHAAEFARVMDHSWHRDRLGKWIAYDKHSGELVGRGGPSRVDVLGGDDIEIGWAVREVYWGRGYATEIGRPSPKFIYETTDVSTVIAFTEIHNRRSRAVMERLGMTYTREIYRPGLVEGVHGVQNIAPFALYTCHRSSCPDAARED